MFVYLQKGILNNILTMISNKIIAKEFLMELVYLWVDKYKNIEKQGFNFSPRFRCEYDEDTKELNIVDKDETGEFYPKNFFGENINVTVIVGENGSGKSSLIDIVYKLLYNIELNFKFIFVYDNYYISNIKSIYVNNNLKEKQIFYWYDENIDFYFYSSEKKRDSISTDEYFSSNYRDNTQHEKEIILSNYFISQRILEIYKNNKKSSIIEISSFFYLPDRVKVSLKAENQILEDIFSNAPNHIRENCFEHFSYDQLLNYSTYNGFLLMLYMLDNGLDIDLLEDNHSMTYLFDEAIIYSKNLVSEIEYKRYFKNHEYIKIEELTEEEENFYFKICANFFHFEFKDSKNREYEDLSSGEKNLYGQLINIYYYDVKYDNKELIYLFDEPEITLHPNWQRNYINEFYLISKILNKRIRFLIASHSPFILSDLPKESIIFLEKGKQVYPFENGQTFGANIHTFLSHGFFMKDGLMGEFAKDKIKSIIKYHEYIEKKEIIEADKIEYKTKKQKEFWQIQSIIGDDYLKQVIKNHLIEIEKLVLGNDEAKKEEVKRLKAQIELLEK